MDKSSQEKKAIAERNELRDRALSLSEISLLIHTYDDIFSDFDPRNYSQRSLSDDFLVEIKRASVDKSSGPLELRFMLSKEKRDMDMEAIIKKRLHNHFRRHHDLIMKEKKKIRRQGIVFTALGVLLILFNTYIYPLKDTMFIPRMLFVILEPTGWFISWFGLDKIFYGQEKMKPEEEFYRKMSTAEILFIGY
jgi:hypothetical protein